MILAIDPKMKRDVLWCISNIAAGSHRHADAVISSPLFPKVVECMRETEPKIVRESAWVISNCVSTSSPDLCYKLLNFNVIHWLVDITRSFTQANLLTVALEAIMNILQAGETLKQIQDPQLGLNGTNLILEEFERNDGHSIVESLQNHEDVDVYHIANKIISTFYSSV